MKKSVRVQSELKPQKVWASPKLKKIDIETITAAGGGSHNDGFDGS
jgi:hypothetical protein